MIKICSAALDYLVHVKQSTTELYLGGVAVNMFHENLENEIKKAEKILLCGSM